MAANALNMFVDSTAVGMAAVQITGKENDLFVAGGYGAFVKSVTGRPPTVVDRNGQAVLVLDQAQVVAMRTWLQSVMKKPKQEPSVKLEMGPAVKPIVAQYIFVIGAVGFGAGFLVSRLLK